MTYNSKVEVLKAENATFKKFRWWSDWIDVAVFDWGACGYLLQMRVSRNNAKKFKCVAYKRAINYGAHPSSRVVGDLTQM